MAQSENRQKTGRKAPKSAFKAGISGNPGGRPKRTPEEFELVAACKAKAPEALAVLMQIMENGENEKNRMTAAQAIIERGFGKPVQPTDNLVSVVEPTPKRPKMTREEWLASLGK